MCGFPRVHIWPNSQGRESGWVVSSIWGINHPVAVATGWLILRSVLWSFLCFSLQALLNLGTSDPSLRLAAYNLLCSVTKSFNLKIEERLLEGTGLFWVWIYLKELSTSEGGLFGPFHLNREKDLLHTRSYRKSFYSKSPSLGGENGAKMLSQNNEAIEAKLVKEQYCCFIQELRMSLKWQPLFCSTEIFHCTLTMICWSCVLRYLSRFVHTCKQHAVYCWHQWETCC